jgi:hypothetical protein
MAARFEGGAHVVEVGDGERRVGLAGWPEILLHPEVHSEDAALEPAPAPNLEFGGLRDAWLPRSPSQKAVAQASAPAGMASCTWSMCSTLPVVDMPCKLLGEVGCRPGVPPQRMVGRHLD